MRIIYIGILISYSLCSLAQDRYFSLSTGCTHNSTYDEGMSSRVYNGSAFHSGIGYNKLKDSLLTNLNLSFDIGAISPGKAKGVAQYLKSEIAYSLQKQIRNLEVSKMNWYLGGTFNILGAYRENRLYSNNAYNYDFATSLGLTSSLHKYFTFRDRTFVLSGNLSFPMIAYVIRPSFASSIPEGFLEGNWEKPVKATLHSGKIQTLNEFFRISTAFQLKYMLSNNNAIAINYAWDFYHISHTHAVNSGSQFIYGTLLFNF